MGTESDPLFSSGCWPRLWTPDTTWNGAELARLALPERPVLREVVPERSSPQAEPAQAVAMAASLRADCAGAPPGQGRLTASKHSVSRGSSSWSQLQPSQEPHCCSSPCPIPHRDLVAKTRLLPTSLPRARVPPEYRTWAWYSACSPQPTLLPALSPFTNLSSRLGERWALSFQRQLPSLCPESHLLLPPQRSCSKPQLLGPQYLLSSPIKSPAGKPQCPNFLTFSTRF